MLCFKYWRQLWLKYREGIAGIDVQSLESLRRAVHGGNRVLIVCNHPSHSDPFVLFRASQHLGRYFYFMANWQTFHMVNWCGRRILQRHGVFSIDRESHDDRAYREAVRILVETPHPLVIFGEGEVYHHYGRIAPFRQGAAYFAQEVARQIPRPVVCIPAAITYRYAEKPIPTIGRLLGLMEKPFGSTDAGPGLAARIRRLGENVLRRHEERYLGHVAKSAYRERANAVLAAILSPMETEQGLKSGKLDIPSRILRLRRSAIQENADEKLQQLLDASRIYSYRHDYDDRETTFEHLAEIVDKFEEDLLGAVTNNRRGYRFATIRFGPPVPVDSAGPVGIRQLNAYLQNQVETLLAELIQSLQPWPTVSW